MYIYIYICVCVNVCVHVHVFAYVIWVDLDLDIPQCLSLTNPKKNPSTGIKSTQASMPIEALATVTCHTLCLVRLSLWVPNHRNAKCLKRSLVPMSILSRWQHQLLHQRHPPMQRSDHIGQRGMVTRSMQDSPVAFLVMGTQGTPNSPSKE